MDGKSIVPFLVSADDDMVPDSTLAHLSDIGNLKSYGSTWRKEVFHEYYYVAYNVKCAIPNTLPASGDYPVSDSWCVNLADNTDCWSSPGGPSKDDPNCYETENPSNNFIALRRFEDGVGTLYAEFQTGDQTVAD